MPLHIPNCIRKFGKLADYSTELGESGHSWTNLVLQHGSNSIPGQRMKQVMDRKVLQEYMTEQLPELKEAVQRQEQRNIKKKQQRVLSAKARATARVADVRTVKAELLSN
jgi:hypothetical protein